MKVKPLFPSLNRQMLAICKKSEHQQTAITALAANAHINSHNNKDSLHQTRCKTSCRLNSSPQMEWKWTHAAIDWFEIGSTQWKQKLPAHLDANLHIFKQHFPYAQKQYPFATPTVSQKNDLQPVRSCVLPKKCVVQLSATPLERYVRYSYVNAKRIPNCWLLFTPVSQPVQRWNSSWENETCCAGPCR